MANLSTRFNSINNEKVFPAISEAVGALVADTEPWARSEAVVRNRVAVVEGFKSNVLRFIDLQFNAYREAYSPNDALTMACETDTTMGNATEVPKG